MTTEYIGCVLRSKALTTEHTEYTEEKYKIVMSEW